MAGRVKTQKERQDELQLRRLCEVFQRRGVQVRREKLSRGRAFRVKSGDCTLENDNLVFVDRRLPQQQQLSVLVDYIFDYGFELDEEELQAFSSRTCALIASRGTQAA